MEIGRKIYFDKATGNVLQDCGERQGDVIETTLDQDFQAHTTLQPYQQSAVGVIQLNYGEDAQNFATYPYHIDIAKTPCVVVWDTTNPLGASLEHIKQAKISQINDFYNQKLSSGFTSSATGEAYIFGYGQSDQMKFMQLAIGVLSNIQPFPVSIPAKDNTMVSHTLEQYQGVLQDIGIFAYTMNGIQHQFIDAVNACTTIEEVNSIVVDFG